MDVIFHMPLVSYSSGALSKVATLSAHCKNEEKKMIKVWLVDWWSHVPCKNTKVIFGGKRFFFVIVGIIVKNIDHVF